MIWLLLTGFFLLAFGIMLVLLLRYRNDSEGGQVKGQDITVYKAQLQELDSDLNNGMLSEAEATSARLEIERRLLKAAGSDKADAPSSTLLSRPLLAAGMAVILLLSVGLYLDIGMPGMPDFPLKDRLKDRQTSGGQRAVNSRASQDMLAKVASLKTRLGDHPDDIKAWRLLGQYQMELHHPDKAAKAFQHWYQLDPDNINAAVIFGESLIVLSEGRVGPAALLILQRARKSHPDNPGVRHYLALAQYQAGDVKQALASWTALEADSPPGAPWLGPLRRWINQARADLGLKAEDSKMPAPRLNDKERKAIADMSPEQQKAMIKGMVGRLADKMAKNPENIEGWFRLAKAYMVLGQRDDVIKSLRQALKYAPDDMKPRVKKQLEILLKQE